MKKETINKTEEEWKQILSKDEFLVLRKKATEPPFSGLYLNNKETGIYLCAACENKLFSSKTKFNSGSGWPSFYDIIDNDSVSLEEDYSIGMKRTEVVCRRCGGHLGHVFDDGPNPTGKRYCINSISLKFRKK